MSMMDFLYFFLILCPRITISINGSKIFEMKGIVYMAIQKAFGKDESREDV